MNLTLLGLMAFQYIGTPYLWGGKDSLGLDCSGLVEKSLFDVGITIPRLNSQGIFDWASKRDGFYSSNPESDCLLFFGKSKSAITHIAIAISDKYMIEAGGAGSDSLNMSASQLAKKDARVRIKPISLRRDLVSCIKIFY